MRIPFPRASVMALGVALATQPATAQTIPGLDNFTIEQARPPAPTPTPTPTTAPPPVVTPTPAATRTPTATPSAAATGTATRPTPAVTPEPRPTPSARASDAPAAAPVVAPSPTQDPGPVTLPPITTPTPNASAEAPLSPAPAPLALGSEDGGLIWWLIGALVLLGAGGAFIWQRRRAQQSGEQRIALDAPLELEEPIAAEPVAGAPPIAAEAAVPATMPNGPLPASRDTGEADVAAIAVPTPPAPTLPPAGLVTTARRPGGLITTALRPMLGVTLAPVRAGIDSLRATLDFTLTLRNEGRAPAHGIFVEAWLVSAGSDSRELAGRLLRSPAGQAMLAPFSLPASATVDLTGASSAQRDELATITAGGRTLFVPMLVVRATWRDARGQPETIGEAFLVGTTRPGQDRLAPLALDRGAQTFTSLAARRLDA